MTKFLSNLRISGCELKDNHYISFILLFKTYFHRCVGISVILSPNKDFLSLVRVTHFRLEGRRGTSDEFTTIPFHLVLFSAAIVELAKSIPVHSLILSSHLFFGLPLFLFPFTVPCRIVFAKPEDLETWPNHFVS